jgi:hypothetical protein
MIIFLIHEQPAQVTGSDCCGKIEGKYTDFKPEPLFKKTRKSLERSEMILNKIRNEIGSVEIHRIDSRNILGIWTMLWKYRQKLHIPFWGKIKFFLLLFRVPCLIINGEYIELDHPAAEKKIDELIKHLRDKERISHGKI